MHIVFIAAFLKVSIHVNALVQLQKQPTRTQSITMVIGKNGDKVWSPLESFFVFVPLVVFATDYIDCWGLKTSPIAWVGIHYSTMSSPLSLIFFYVCWESSTR